MVLSLKKFVEGINQLPGLCGWVAGTVTLEGSDMEGCVYVCSDIHHSLVDDGEVYTPFYILINEARSLFGNALVDSEIRETGNENAPYDLFLTIRFKRKTQESEQVQSSDVTQDPNQKVIK